MSSHSQQSLASLQDKSDDKLGDGNPATVPGTPSEPVSDERDVEKGIQKNEATIDRPGEKSIEHDPQFLVQFDNGDKTNPKNWHALQKAWITLQLGFLALVGSLGSAIISPAEDQIAEDFNISSEVSVLVVALYVLGFAVGPMMWGPISESHGRKWSILPAIFALSMFSIGSGFTQNPQSLFITRFFGGLFGSAPISNVSAALGDIYDAKTRGISMAFYSVCVIGGVGIGPLLGSAITVNPNLGWRWTMYIEAMFAFFMVLLVFFAMPETYAPVLLKKKAIRLRKETGDQRYWHPHESVKITPQNVVKKYFSRPVVMLVTEPLVTCLAFYASFVYGMLYLFLEVFPIVFSGLRGWGPVVSTLPFLSILTGTIISVGINIANQPLYMKAVVKNKGRPVPEARMPPMILGGVFFVSGLFWFGWTAGPEYHWASPVIAAAFIGSGFNIIFQQALNALVDSYGMYAASATSANTLLRSLFACALPLAAGPMFRNLGVGPAVSILGGVSCLALPVPFIFMKYGKALRKKSKFAPYEEDD